MPPLPGGEGRGLDSAVCEFFSRCGADVWRLLPCDAEEPAFPGEELSHRVISLGETDAQVIAKEDLRKRGVSQPAGSILVLGYGGATGVTASAQARILGAPMQLFIYSKEMRMANYPEQQDSEALKSILSEGLCVLASCIGISVFQHWMTRLRGDATAEKLGLLDLPVSADVQALDDAMWTSVSTQEKRVLILADYSLGGVATVVHAIGLLLQASQARFRVQCTVVWEKYDPESSPDLSPELQAVAANYHQCGLQSVDELLLTRQRCSIRSEMCCSRQTWLGRLRTAAAVVVLPSETFAHLAAAAEALAAGIPVLMCQYSEPVLRLRACERGTDGALDYNTCTVQTKPWSRQPAELSELTSKLGRNLLRGCREARSHAGRLHAALEDVALGSAQMLAARLALLKVLPAADSGSTASSSSRPDPGLLARVVQVASGYGALYDPRPAAAVAQPAEEDPESEVELAFVLASGPGREQARAEPKASEGKVICVCCFSNIPNVLFRPCGHVCLCTSCAAKWQQQKDTCPVCNTAATPEKVFLASSDL